MSTLARPAIPQRPPLRKSRVRTARRNAELFLLVCASIVVGIALALTYRARSAEFTQVTAKLKSGELVNVNQVSSPQQLLPLLKNEFSASELPFAATKILQSRHALGGFPNAGALAKIRVHAAEVDHDAGLRRFALDIRHEDERREQRQQERLANMTFIGRALERVRAAVGGRPSPPSIALLHSEALARLKPSIVVREPGAFRNRLMVWGALYLLAFYAVHFFWRWSGFAGDATVLPIMHVLTGCGFALMVSLRDPVRDTLIFPSFITGVLAGAVVMAVLSSIDFERTTSRLSFLFLAGSVILALALAIFGTGPGASDAKVNVLGFQPVELMRMLLVFFLAGYFSQHWDALRQLEQKRGWYAPYLAKLGIGRLDYVLPVSLGVVASLLLFVWLRDMGPALIIAGLFFTLYCLARGQARMFAIGLGLLFIAFGIAYQLGWPETVTDRVKIWLSTWDNTARGGDQIAHSLWSLSAGGTSGSGLGMGEGESVPAGHTDLILAVLAEEVGFIGLACIFLLYGILAWRSFRIALRAPGTYSFFLVTGLTLIVIYQLVLIAAGIMGVLPLTGVVSPFLSYGGTSMIANFAIFAIILSISARDPDTAHAVHFGHGIRMLEAGLAIAALVLITRAGYVQIVKADDILVRGALVKQGDGGRRYQYNPRIREAAARLPKGTIYDRAGLPMATSDWDLIEKHKAEYAKLGLPLEATSKPTDRRHYPLGPSFFYILGDVRSRLKQGARATSFEEREGRVRLQGYDDSAAVEEITDPDTGETFSRLKYDYSPLIPLVRHRNEPNHPDVKRLMEANRDVKMSIDAAFQLKLSNALASWLTSRHVDRGSLVVMDATTGEVLAMVSHPWPSTAQLNAVSASGATDIPQKELIDRARFGRYTPGSSFKIVTALAALRVNPALATERFDCVPSTLR